MDSLEETFGPATEEAEYKNLLKEYISEVKKLDNQRWELGVLGRRKMSLEEYEHGNIMAKETLINGIVELINKDGNKSVARGGTSRRLKKKTKTKKYRKPKNKKSRRRLRKRTRTRRR